MNKNKKVLTCKNSHDILFNVAADRKAVRTLEITQYSKFVNSKMI